MKRIKSLYNYFIKIPYWDNVTRTIHFGLAVTITIQIFSGFFLYGGVDVIPPPAAVFMHKYSGFLALIFIICQWVWCCINPKLFRHLYPWNKRGRKKIKEEIKGILNKQLPPKGLQGGLPGFVEGLGILAATALAITGNPLPVIFYFTQSITNTMHTLREIHIYIVPFLCAFWLGHTTMAIVNYFVQKKKNPTNPQ